MLRCDRTSMRVQIDQRVLVVRVVVVKIPSRHKGAAEWTGIHELLQRIFQLHYDLRLGKVAVIGVICVVPVIIGGELFCRVRRLPGERRAFVCTEGCTKDEDGGRHGDAEIGSRFHILRFDINIIT